MAPGGHLGHIAGDDQTATTREGRPYVPERGRGGVVALALSIGVAADGPLEDAQAANSREDYTTALQLFRSLADQGNATAQYELGLMHRLGRGVPQDYAEAAKWYRRAADQGLSLAQFGLGIMYDFGGQGVPQDDVRADYLRLNGRTFTIPAGGPFLVGDTFTTGGNNIQMATVGINYRFDWSSPVVAKY